MTVESILPKNGDDLVPKSMTTGWVLGFPVYCRLFYPTFRYCAFMS